MVRAPPVGDAGASTEALAMKDKLDPISLSPFVKRHQKPTFHYFSLAWLSLLP